jgi:hypothetical protein
MTINDEYIEILFNHTVNNHTYQLHLSDGAQRLLNDLRPLNLMSPSDYIKAFLNSGQVF